MVRNASSQSPNAVLPPAKITVIGLGNMGRPMAACLVRAGYDVTGFDVSAAARKRYIAEGGKTADDGVAASAADAVITLLPDGKIVRAAQKLQYGIGQQ